jgi:integrase
MRGRGEERVFSPLLKGRNGYGDAVGKWFARHLDKLGIKDPSKVIHSFRRTVNTKLHELRVPQAYILALIGHEGDSVNERDYLHGKEYFAIASLREEIEKLNFKGSLQAAHESVECSE